MCLSHYSRRDGYLLRPGVVLLQGYSKKTPPHSNHPQACTRAPDRDQAVPMHDLLMSYQEVPVYTGRRLLLRYMPVCWMHNKSYSPKQTTVKVKMIQLKTRENRR